MSALMVGGRTVALACHPLYGALEEPDHLRDWNWRFPERRMLQTYVNGKRALVATVRRADWPIERPTLAFVSPFRGFDDAADAQDAWLGRRSIAA